MADTALGSLGADVSFAVAYSIAGELLEAAQEAAVSEDELVAVVLALSIVLGSLPRGAKALLQEARERRWLGLSPPKAEPTEGEGGQVAPAAPSGLAHFAVLLLSMAQRISTSTAIQLLARGVSTNHPYRAARIVSLLSVSLFFLFLDASSSVATSARRG